MAAAVEEAEDVAGAATGGATAGAREVVAEKEGALT